MKIRKDFHGNIQGDPAAIAFNHVVPTAPTAAKEQVTLKQVTVSTNSLTPLKVMIRDASGNEGWIHFVAGSIDWHGSQPLGWDPDNEPSGVDMSIRVENLPYGKHCFVEVDYSKE